MAKRKTVQPPDIVNDETGQNSPTPAAQVPTAESPQIPDFTVRIYPLRNPRSKLLATASLNIAGAFAVRGFRIFDSENGLFVKEPQQNYIKNNTEMTSSVFFPITKEARTALYDQILDSYKLVTQQERAKQAEGTAWLMGEDDGSTVPEVTPDDDLPFGQDSPPPPTEDDMPAMVM